MEIKNIVGSCLNCGVLIKVKRLQYEKASKESDVWVATCPVCKHQQSADDWENSD